VIRIAIWVERAADDIVQSPEKNLEGLALTIDESGQIVASEQRC
jgi:flagellar biosynthesis regulator FlaF